MKKDRAVRNAQLLRPSLQELYGNHAGFVKAVTTAANQLVNERFLLDVDAKADISAAKASNVLQ